MGALVVRAKPYKHDSGWPTTPENALRQNTDTAQTTSSADTIVFYGFDFSDLPSNIIVTGISVRLEAKKDHAGGSGDLKFAVALSYDGGISYDNVINTDLLQLTMGTFVVGGVTEDWGHTPEWTFTELTTPDNFRVGLTTDYDSIVSTPTWHLAWLTATVHYDEDDTPTNTTSDTVGITETVVSSIIHDIVYEKINVSDSGSISSSATRQRRGIQQIAQSGTAVTLLESDATFSATAERPRRQEAFGAAIQLGTAGPTVYVGDATVLTASIATYPFSYMQAGLLTVSDLTSEATFVDGFLLPTVEVRLANKDYVDQSDTSDLVPKTIAEHSLGLPTVGRSLIVWGMAESGDGWKKRIVFNGDIEDIQFFDSEIIVRGIQLGTTQQPVPDIIVDENLFAYEPGSTAEDTGEEIEENKGKAVPIGIGRFDYGAVKLPTDFDAGHPFRFTAQSPLPAEDLRTYSQIALFPAMMGLKHPMMPTIHVARRYRRTEADAGTTHFSSWPWQNVLLYGSRKSTPNLSVSVGSTDASQPLALQYPNVDTASVTDAGLHNNDRYVMIWTWHSSDHGSRGMPCIKPISDAAYVESKNLQDHNWPPSHVSAGSMEHLGYPYQRSVWTDGTATDAYGIFLNINAPEPSGYIPKMRQWPGVWQAVALQMAGVTEINTRTHSWDQRDYDNTTLHNPSIRSTPSPPFETVDTDDPEHCIRLDRPEAVTHINTGGSLSIRTPLDGPGLGTIRMVKFCMLWNPTTSGATDVRLFARFAPFSNWAIIHVAMADAGADYNLNKNVVFNTTDYIDAQGVSLPILKLSGVTDRSFASFLMVPYYDPHRGRLATFYDTEPKEFLLPLFFFPATVWQSGRYRGGWDFVARDYVREGRAQVNETFFWPGDVMIKAIDGDLNVVSCWLEVVHQSSLGDDVKEPLVQEFVREFKNTQQSLRHRYVQATETFRTEHEFTRPNARLSVESSIYVTGKGVIDDSGELTGVAGRIIENPVDICNTLIRHYLGDSVFQARATGSTFGSFDTARTILGATTYRMTVVVNPTNSVNIKQVLSEIALQAKAVCRERIDDNGNLQWIFYVDTENPAVSDPDRLYTGFTGGFIRWNNLAAGTLSASFVPYEELSSSVTLRYGLHLPTGTWSNTVYCTPEATNFAVDATLYRDAMEFARTEYKVENPITIDAPDIWDPAVAEILCKWHCNLVRRRRLFVEFETYANAFDLEPGHVIQFDDEIGDRIAYPGEGNPNWSNHYFNVTHVSMSKDVGQLARVYVRALEVHSEP